jgi:hypothetical protein
MRSSSSCWCRARVLVRDPHVERLSLNNQRPTHISYSHSRSIRDIKLGVGAIKSAGLDLADIVLTGLDNLLNYKPLETAVTFPRYSNCALLNPLVSYFSLGITGFNLAQFTEDNVFLVSSSDAPNSVSVHVFWIVWLISMVVGFIAFLTNFIACFSLVQGSLTLLMEGQ